jgi:Ca2+-binding EF-hand superfamily protein
MSIDIKQVFNYFDFEETNSINKNYIPKALRYLGIIQTQNDLNLLINNLPDSISYENFIEIYNVQKTKSLTKEQLINAFESFDENKTGKCSSKILFHSLKSIGEKLSEEDIIELSSKCSIDENGNIDYIKLIEELY